MSPAVDTAKIAVVLAAALVGAAIIGLGSWMVAKKACEMLAARDARRVSRELAGARLMDQASWRDFVRGHPEATSHPYVRWDHCDQCYATFERTNNAEGGRR